MFQEHVKLLNLALLALKSQYVQNALKSNFDSRFFVRIIRYLSSSADTIASVCEILEIFGNFWKFLEISGNLWKSLEP